MSAGIAIQRAVIASLFYRNSDTAQTFFIGAIIKWERTDGRQLPTQSDCRWECDFDHSQHYGCKTDSWAIYCQSNSVVVLYYWLQLVCIINSVDLNYFMCRSDVKNRFVSSTQPPSWSGKHRWQMSCQVVSILGSQPPSSMKGIQHKIIATMTDAPWIFLHKHK